MLRLELVPALALALALLSPTVLAQAGSLDPAFGAGGEVTLTPGTTQGAFAVVPVAGGLLVAGSLDGDAAVYRLTTAGALDPAFGTGGVATMDLGADGSAVEMVVLPSGRIVIAVNRIVDGTAEAGALVAFTPSGEIDAAFGGGGIVGVVGPQSAVLGLDADAQGRLLVSGTEDDGSGTGGPFVARFTPGGAPDAAFGTAGVLRFSLGGDAAFVQRLAATPAGGAVVVGQRLLGSAFAFEPFVARVTPAGELDAAFGTGGIARLDFAGTFDGLVDVALDDVGRVVAVGFEGDLFAGTAALVVARLTPGGALDATFAGDGVASSRFGLPIAQGLTLALQPDGKVLAGGAAGSGQTGRFLVARFTADGAPDAAFGTNGATVLPAAPDTEIAYGLALRADRIVAAGARTGAPDAPPSAVRVVQLVNDVTVGVGDGPTASGLGLSHAGAHPAPGVARVALTLAAPQPVEVAVVDAAGRVVATLARGPLGAGRHAFDVGAGLPPGLYHVRAAGSGGAAATLGVVLVR